MTASRPVPFTRRTLRAALASAALLAAAGLAIDAPPASATTQGLYSMEVLVDGRPLTELTGNGRTYVEALAGREYSLRLTNHTGRCVAMAVSVDGLNSIDAKTTAAGDGQKWIVGPYETITLSGWQTSSNLARRFFFTTEAASYGAWLGKTDNLGVISAVIFRERVPEPAPIVRRWMEQARPEGAPMEPGSARGDIPAVPAPPAMAVPKTQSAEQRAGEREAATAPSAPLDDYAATGIGRELDHPVERVSFDAEAKPAACLELRYEYRNALVKLGLLPRVHPRPDGLARRERARGFTDTGFAPDPYRDQ